MSDNSEAKLTNGGGQWDSSRVDILSTLDVSRERDFYMIEERVINRW